mmetsp:Transcript_62842/g.107908  ORF Transcript_62842/g.107908 Transcript_62842/m.107908 type:complete len:109 (+) Transcript_62842:127-453(+)
MHFAFITFINLRQGFERTVRELRELNARLSPPCRTCSKGTTRLEGTEPSSRLPIAAPHDRSTAATSSTASVAASLRFASLLKENEEGVKALVGGGSAGSLVTCLLGGL